MATLPESAIDAIARWVVKIPAEGSVRRDLALLAALPAVLWIRVPLVIGWHGSSESQRT